MDTIHEEDPFTGDNYYITQWTNGYTNICFSISVGEVADLEVLDIDDIVENKKVISTRHHCRISQS